MRETDTPQEEEKETPEEEETVIPTTKAKAKRKPKMPNEPKNKSKDIVISLETTEYADDQKHLTPEPSLLDHKNEATPPEVIAPKPKTKSRAKAKATDKQKRL